MNLTIGYNCCRYAGKPFVIKKKRADFGVETNVKGGITSVFRGWDGEIAKFDFGEIQGWAWTAEVIVSGEK